MSAWEMRESSAPSLPSSKPGTDSAVPSKAIDGASIAYFAGTEHVIVVPLPIADFTVNLAPMELARYRMR